LHGAQTSAAAYCSPGGSASPRQSAWFRQTGAKQGAQEGHFHYHFKNWVLSLVARAVAANLKHRGWMKLLCASSDLGELKGLVKRLVRIGIPCAVCKESIASQLSVWIQQDNDFPLALKMLVEQKKPRPLPPWVSLLELAVPAAADRGVPATDGLSTPSVMVVQPRGPTWTGSA
jgi:hypothetical protein